MTIGLTTLVTLVMLAASACAPPTDDTALRSGRLAGNSTGFQREILADGIVTRAEYERAIAATIACMQQQGLAVTGPLEINAGRFLGYVVGLGPDEGPGGAPSDTFESVQTLCEATYLDGIAAAWIVQQQPTGSEAEAVRIDYVECLRERGLDIDSNASIDSFESDPTFVADRRARPCIEQYSTNVFLFSQD